MASAAGSSPVHQPNYNPSLRENGCLGIGLATVIGALTYSGLYAAGYCRNQAFNAVKLSLPGLAVGAYGLHLRKIRHRSVGPSPLTVPSDATRAMEGAVQNLPNDWRSLKSCEIASYVDADNLQQATAFEAYLLEKRRYGMLGIQSGDLGGALSKTAQVPFLNLAVEDIVKGYRSDASGTLVIPEALSRFLAELLAQKENACSNSIGLVVRLDFGDSQPDQEALSLLAELLKGTPNLISISCVHGRVNDVEHNEIWKQVLEANPKLVNVPHLKRDHAEALQQHDAARADSCLELCDLLDAKRQERVPQLKPLTTAT